MNYRLHILYKTELLLRASSMSIRSAWCLVRPSHLSLHNASTLVTLAELKWQIEKTFAQQMHGDICDVPKMFIPSSMYCLRQLQPFHRHEPWPKCLESIICFVFFHPVPIFAELNSLSIVHVLLWLRDPCLDLYTVVAPLTYLGTWLARLLTPVE